MLKVTDISDRERNPDNIDQKSANQTWNIWQGLSYLYSSPQVS